MKQLLYHLNKIDSNLDNHLETSNDNLLIPNEERCTSHLGSLSNIEEEFAKIHAKYLALKKKRNDAYKRWNEAIQELKQESQGFN